MRIMKHLILLFMVSVFFGANAQEIIFDAEYQKLLSQHGEKWASEDQDIAKKLAALEKKHGKKPNIIHMMWDDSGYGDAGDPILTKLHGLSTPNIAKLADEGMTFTRMYTEPSCTPTRAAALTGRHPVRSGMWQVIFPIHGIGLPAEEVTIAEILSDNGYQTAFFGKAHQGDIEESYLHNQGFDEALFTPMNQITSLYNPQGNAANAVLGLHPEQYPKDPYQLDETGLLPKGWVQILDAKKGQLAEEWCGNSNECYEKMETESENRTIAFIQKNAQAKKPFFVQYWPNFLNFLKPEPQKTSVNGGKVPNAYTRLDAFVGRVKETLHEEGIAENTLFLIMADNGPMVHNPPPGWGMTEILYRGGKGDYTEGGIRVPAIAYWPGMIKEKQLVGDIIHVTDLFTTFAKLGEATDNIPTDRIIDGLDQTSVLLNGDTHGRRDYVYVYQGNTLAAIVKGRYKRHLISSDPGGATGIGADFYDLYQDPREENPHLVPLIHTQGQYNRMHIRHELMKKKYPDKLNGKGIPLTGISNARPETKAIKTMVENYMKLMPIDVQEYIKYDDSKMKVDGDWGH